MTDDGAGAAARGRSPPTRAGDPLALMNTHNDVIRHQSVVIDRLSCAISVTIAAAQDAAAQRDCLIVAWPRFSSEV